MSTDRELADKVQRFLLGDPVCGGFPPEEWQQILAALRRPSGDYVMVPREPTDAMIRAGNASRGPSQIRGVHNPRSIYRAMLTAAEASKGDKE